MTLKEIHAMFKPGQRWDAVNSKLQSSTGPRVVQKVQLKQICWSLSHPEAPTSSWMTFPKAVQIIEARDGYLKFAVSDSHTLTLTRA